jgi:predicted ribosome quality control (RQC) complex YloA/Tae2 family protein
MQVEFDLNKSVDENAGRYYNKAKKAKKKLEGAQVALIDSKKKLEKLQKEEGKFWVEEEKRQEKRSRKLEWYEKFHWFMSSEDFLCIGGKDATSNEIVVKKHTDKEDLVFHTDMAGSPFFVIKNGQNASAKTIEECGQAVAVYSRAWKLGYSSADVFYVKPEQVTKEAKAGESLSRGSFMVYGKTEYLKPKLEMAVGLVGEEVIGGPVDAVKSHTDKFVIVIPGKNKKSELAKKIRAKLKGGDLDDYIKFLPSGGAEIRK